MTKALSPTMVEALAEIRDRCDGRVVRYPGGFWTYAGCPWNGGAPQFYIGPSTIQALVDREELAYDEWKDGRKGRFPVAATLSQQKEASNG